MKLRRIIVSAALFVLSLSLSALAQQAGTASGTLTVNGKAAKLSHAYARIFK